MLFRGGGRGEGDRRAFYTWRGLAGSRRRVRSSISGKAGSRGRPSVRDETRTRRLAARFLCQNARPINSPPARGRPSVVSHLPSIARTTLGWMERKAKRHGRVEGRNPWSRGLVRITRCHHRLWSAAVGSDGIGVGWDPWAGVAAGSWQDTMMLIRPCGRGGGVQLSISKGSASSARARPPPKSALVYERDCRLGY